MTVADLAAVTGLSWDTVKNIIKNRLEKDYGHPRLKDLQRLSIDEIYLLKEALGLLWEQPTYAKMNAFLHEWCDLAAQSAIRQMMQLAKTLLSHKSGILSWWKQRINNGRMEGINNKIKTLLRQTYGLRDERYFVLKLYSLHHARQELLG